MAAIFKFLWVIISLSFFGYCAYFAVVNAGEIDLILLPTLPTLTVPIWLAMLLAFGAGLLIVGTAASLRLMQVQFTIRSLRKQLAKQALIQAPNHDKTGR